ncbi:MAG: DUF899 family protein, partial [Pseudomonadota bacterium]|nr:DUF899 family protein [Pseudomonadota bacterium]
MLEGISNSRSERLADMEGVRMTVLRPALNVANEASRPYPNDDKIYRQARTALLAEEIELRRRIERVAQLRRALPPGGQIPQDYALKDRFGETVPFSSLFGRHDTLVTIFWM